MAVRLNSIWKFKGGLIFRDVRFFSLVVLCALMQNEIVTSDVREWVGFSTFFFWSWNMGKVRVG